MYDLKITGGTIVDGTGADRFDGDVAVKDGVIVAVSHGPLDGAAAETVDAAGMLVTPGFVDVHTHYDGQATWDPILAPSSGHGVTTIVAGNCGVGFAPVRPGPEQWLIGLMEGVEDIPGTALSEGMDWTWETFPEYLDALDRRTFAIDIGVQVSHGAVRAYSMGERGAANEPANPDDIAAMAVIVREAVEAGALGFSTSRTMGHRAMDGRPVPGTFAAEDELFALGRAMADGGRGVFELAPMGAAGEDIAAPKIEIDWMCRLADTIGMPVSFALEQVAAAPDLWRELMDESIRATDAGAPVYPQVAARPVHPQRPLRVSGAMALGAPIDAAKDHVQRNPVLAPLPHDVEAGPDDAHEVTAVHARQIVLRPDGSNRRGPGARPQMPPARCLPRLHSRRAAPTSLRRQSRRSRSSFCIHEQRAFIVDVARQTAAILTLLAPEHARATQSGTPETAPLARRPTRGRRATIDRPPRRARPARPRRQARDRSGRPSSVSIDVARDRRSRADTRAGRRLMPMPMTTASTRRADPDRLGEHAAELPPRAGPMTRSFGHLSSTGSAVRARSARATATPAASVTSESASAGPRGRTITDR